MSIYGLARASNKQQRNSITFFSNLFLWKHNWYLFKYNNTILVQNRRFCDRNNSKCANLLQMDIYPVYHRYSLCNSAQHSTDLIASRTFLSKFGTTVAHSNVCSTTSRPLYISIQDNSTTIITNFTIYQGHKKKI